MNKLYAIAGVAASIVGAIAGMYIIANKSVDLDEQRKKVDLQYKNGEINAEEYIILCDKILTGK